MSKLFEVAEQQLYSFLDTILRLGGMAVQGHVSQFIASLTPKEDAQQQPAESPAQPKPLEAEEN